MAEPWPWDRQRAAYAAIALGALGMFVVLMPSSGAHFARFLGPAHPVLVMIGTSMAGGAALWWLKSSEGFEIVRGSGATRRGLGVSAVLASALAVAIIAADVFLRYPHNVNVPVPQALLFYPSIGFVAEIVFHVVPLALVLLAAGPVRARLDRDRLVVLTMVVVAALEPIFQVLLEGRPLVAGSAYTWIHVFAIALLQLLVFRRYDFVSMLGFRLCYYAYWHLLWGVVRLEVLF